jgi:signal transduction histidine kinase
MESLSHFEPIIEPAWLSPPDAAHLAGAFSDFIKASARLEAAYGTLQAEVTELSHELADRNAALKLSLEENERVHRALQQIVEAMPCGVLVVNRDGSVVMLNPEARALLNIDAGTEPHLQAISRESGVDLVAFLGRSSPGQLEHNRGEQEFACTTSQGKRWLSVHDRVLAQPSSGGVQTGNHQQTILILRDVSAHKHAEQERERARRAIALSEVATTLAHEIRNPLAGLELFAGLISAGGPDTQEWISHLHAGIRSLSATVNNVLSFHGVGFPELTPIDLAESIRSSVEFSRPIADEAGIALHFQAPVANIFVLGNSSALQQLVLNMVCNAIRHTRPGGIIEVVVTTVQRNGIEGGLATISFRDSGTGIPAEHLQDIFRAGFSVSGSTSGLGLAVCRQIAQQHAGSIRVSSVLGEGTTFIVEMPSL